MIKNTNNDNLMAESTCLSLHLIISRSNSRFSSSLVNLRLVQTAILTSIIIDFVCLEINGITKNVLFHVHRL